MDRQLEYDTGPVLERAERSESADSESRDDFVDAPWKVGLAAGAGTFVSVYAITYQIASAIIAVGAMGPPELRPSRRVLAALIMLGSHGGTIEVDGEPIVTGFQASGRALGTSFGGLTSHLTALVPVVALVAAGYLLVRHVAEDDLGETARTAARAGGAFVAGYVVLAALLASFFSWTPEGDPDDSATGEAADPEAVAVAVDSSLVITVAGTAVAFLALGGFLALLVTFGDRAADDGRDADPGNGGGDERDPDAESGERDPDVEGDERDSDGGDAGLEAGRTTDGDEPAADRSPATGADDYSPRRSADPDRGYDDASGRYGGAGGRYGGGR